MRVLAILLLAGGLGCSSFLDRECDLQDHTATLLQDGRVLLHGFGADPECYDPRTGTFSSLPMVEAPR